MGLRLNSDRHKTTRQEVGGHGEGREVHGGRSRARNRGDCPTTIEESVVHRGLVWKGTSFDRMQEREDGWPSKTRRCLGTCITDC